jgi:hypothetical protein
MPYLYYKNRKPPGRGTEMTKTEIKKAAQKDGDAMAKLIKTLQGTDDFDTIGDLIEDLIAATRKDAADDVVVDLKSEGYTEAADFIKVNY